MAKIDERISALERKAKRKLSRLKSKGIRTGSITPIKNASGFTREQKESYARKLAGFIDNAGYSKGADGTPIPNSLIQQIRYNERKIDKYRAERYGYDREEAKKRKTAMGDMTLEQFHMMGTRFDPKKGKYVYNTRASHAGSLPLPEHDIDTFKSVKDARKYLSRLHTIQTEEYQNKKMETLIKNIHKRAEAYPDNEELQSLLKSLTLSELDRLYAESDFLDVLFIDSPPRKKNQYTVEALEQATFLDDQENILIETINKIKGLSAAGSA